MHKIALKTLCSIGVLYGAIILVFACAFLFQGYFASLDNETIALKIGATLFRAMFLFLCAWAAWQAPHQAARFAWGAFFAFAIGGAADVIAKYGIVGGFGSLIPSYYITVGAHAAFAFLVWLLTPKAAAMVGG